MLAALLVAMLCMVAQAHAGADDRSPVVVRVLVDPLVVPPYKPANVSVIVTHANGTPAIGVMLALSPSGGMLGHTDYLTTMYYNPAKRNYIYYNFINTTFLSGAEGRYTITVRAVSNDFAVAYGTATIGVSASGIMPPAAQSPLPTPAALPVSQAPRPSPSPTPDPGVLTPATVLQVLFVLLILFTVALVVGMLVYLLLRRNLRLVPGASSAPGDGKAVVPIKVMLMNGLGARCRPMSDMPIELASTAGTIRGVTLPATHDIVEANLAAPREFGTAVITARANGKKATATVAFTYKLAAFEVGASPDTIAADGQSTTTLMMRIRDMDGTYIAPIAERPLELKTTLGTVTGPAAWPAKAEYVVATFTAGDDPGTATITAASGDIQGDCQVTLTAVPATCASCGAPVEPGTAQCPKCRVTPQSAGEARRCLACGAVVPETAPSCSNCGAKQPEK